QRTSRRFGFCSLNIRSLCHIANRCRKCASDRAIGEFPAAYFGNRATDDSANHHICAKITSWSDSRGESARYPAQETIAKAPSACFGQCASHDPHKGGPGVKIADAFSGKPGHAANSRHGAGLQTGAPTARYQISADRRGQRGTPNLATGNEIE